MNTPSAPLALPRCPACRKGHLHTSTRTRVFHPQGQTVTVELQISVCDACHAEVTRPNQHQENLRRLAARKAHYGDVLMGEEMVALRKRYGLTQQQASKLFGKGKIAFSRYENETTYPDDSTRLLLTLAMRNPAVLKQLADTAQVNIPLWNERREDEQRTKVTLLRAVPTVAKQDFQQPPASPQHPLPERGLLLDARRPRLVSQSISTQRMWSADVPSTSVQVGVA